MNDYGRVVVGPDEVQDNEGKVEVNGHAKSGRHKIGEQEYYMDGYLFDNFIRAKELVKKDWDVIGLYDGYEGCQPAGSKVLMSDGTFKNIEEVKVGDKVLSPQHNGTNTFATVTDVTKWMSKENYVVKMSSGTKKELYTCSSNHLIPFYYIMNETEQVIDIRADECSDISKKLMSFRFVGGLLIHASVDVEKIEGSEVYGFTLDSKSGWYVTDNWMVTHNSGKSVKAMQDAYFFDNTFCLERVCFNDKEFKTAILKAEKYQAVVYDEAFSGLSSREAMGRINRSLVKMLAEIRQKRLFVLIVMPTFFDLDKYVALWRSRYLIHVYTDRKGRRGSFKFFNIDYKKMLFVNGKKYYSYSVKTKYMQEKHLRNHNFRGKFTNHYVVDEAEYRKLKNEGMHKRQQDAEEKEMSEEVEARVFSRIVGLVGMTNGEKAEMLGMTRRVYQYRLNKWKTTAESL